MLLEFPKEIGEIWRSQRNFFKFRRFHAKRQAGLGVSENRLEVYAVKRIFFVAMLATGCNKDVEFAGQTADKANPVVLSDQEFPAALLNDEKVAYVPAFGLVEEEVTLREKPPVTSSLRQQERPVGVDTYRQGNDGSFSEEEFEISTAGKVDLIVVVDDSSSMADEQASLAPNLGSLTKYLISTDWQIGVVTTTVKPGDNDNANDLPCVLQNVAEPGKPIRKGDADPEKTFFDTVNGIGTAGSGHERGIKQAMRVADDKCGAKWIRDDAALAVFFVADEQSYCKSNLCPEKDAPKDFLDLVRKKRPDNKLKAYALTWKVDANDPVYAKCKVDTTLTQGTRYIDVVRALGGINGSVCVDGDPATNDYEAILEKISRDVARNVKYDFALKHEPAPGARVVATVDGMPFTDFEVVGSMLKLKNVSGESLKLKVGYRYDSTPKTDRFALSSKAALDTVEVFVDGDRVEPSRISFDDQTNELVLMDMPGDDAQVKLKYRKEGALPTILDLARLLMNGAPAGVWVNGAPVNDYQYDETTGVITFKDPPDDGAEVKVSHRLQDSKTLRYVPGWQDATEGTKWVLAKDAATGEAVEVQVDGGELVFSDGDVWDARKVIVTYDYGSEKDTLTHELMHEPIAGTLQVQTDEGKTGCITDVRVEEHFVTYSCNGEELGPVTISYQYVMERYTSFEISGELPEDASVQVYVDGSYISDFKRDGNTVRVPEKHLTNDSVVRIIATTGS